MTIEELQAENLRLAEERDAARAELATANETLTTTQQELERVRTVNQDMYLRLRAQDNKTEETKDPEEKPPMTCKEFALTVKI